MTSNSLRTPVRPHSGTGGWAFSVWLITIVPITIWRGWVLSVVWNWFIPNTFHGAPVLTIGQALGVALVVSVLTYGIGVAASNGVSKDARGKSTLFLVSSSLVTSLISGALFLLLGFIYHFFV